MGFRSTSFILAVLWPFLVSAGIPDDPGWTKAPYLHGLGLEQVWETYGFDLGTAGRKPPVIAIVDNGVPRNRDLKIWENPGEIPDNGIDDDENGYIDDVNGYNVMRGNADLSYSGSHGSRIAHIAGSLTNNNVGSASPASVAALMPVIYYEHVPGGHFSALDGIWYAILNGADIVNCSFVSESAVVYDAILVLAEKEDAIIVAGAGNNSRDLDQRKLYPAAIDHPLIVSVGSLKGNNSIGDSNYGAESVDLFAPAESSSYAVPLVASTLALLKALKPNASSRELIWALLEGVEEVESLQDKCVSGGKLYVLGSVQALMSGDFKDVSSREPPAPVLKGLMIDENSLFLEWESAEPVDRYEIQASFGNGTFEDWAIVESTTLPLDFDFAGIEPVIFRVRSVRNGAASDYTTTQAFTRADFLSMLRPSLSHFWGFDEGYGSLAFDSGTAGLNLQLDDSIRWNAEFQLPGSSLVFRDFHTGLRIPDAPSINLSNQSELSVTLRVRLDPAAGEQTAVLYEQGGYWRGLNLVLSEGWLIAGAWNRPAHESNWKGTFLNGGMLPVGRWVDIALVLEGGTTVTENGLRLYIDGVKAAAGSASMLWPCYEQTGIAQVQGGTVFKDREIRYLAPFQGAIDSLGIWNHALRLDEIESGLF